MMRSDTVLGAISGVAAGYVLWLVAISIGEDVATVSKWSLVVLIGAGVLVVVAGVWGWLLRWRGRRVWAAFTFGLPILPVVLTLAVLADIANIGV